MGKRKFSLSTRKNLERKKYKSMKSTSNDELIVQLPLNIYLSVPTTEAKCLYERIQKSNVLPDNWALENLLESRSTFIISKIFSYGKLDIFVTSKCQWRVRVDDTPIFLPNHSFNTFSDAYLQNVNDVLRIIENAEESTICIGNPNKKFEICKHRNGQFLNHAGTAVTTYFDDRNLPSPHSDCVYFISNSIQRCLPCDQYRSQLYSLVSRFKKQAITGSRLSIQVNHRYLTHEEKTERLQSMRKKNEALIQKTKRLQRKLSKALETTSVILDGEMSADIQQIMEDEDQRVCANYSENSLQHIFWKQQKESLGREGSLKNRNRWHPLMIKWCLYMRHQSNKCYEAIRDSGCISLPSQRTLRDYSNAVNTGAGFSTEVDEQLLQAADLRNSPDYHRLVVLLMDEMHINEDLIYNKHSGRLVGFSDLGEINNLLSQFEETLGNDTHENNVGSSTPLANSMIVFMVRGLFSRLKFPYVQFPCNSVTGEQLFNPFWEAVYRLERMGFKVLATTFDGASVNRRLIALQDSSSKLVYKLRNLYAVEERYIYCFNDLPHLLKTVRNCWQSNNRCMWNNGKHIQWQHLIDLYRRDNGKGTGLSLIPKLKYDHVYLTSFSKMRVDLAAQVSIVINKNRYMMCYLCTQ